MNPDEILDLLQTNMQAALVVDYPGVLVTREAKDFASYSETQVRAVVVTIISEGLADLKAPREVEEHAGTLKISLLAEFKLPERVDNAITTGLAVEKAEWALWAKLAAFFQAPGAGLCPLDAIRMWLSQQRTVPYGFVAVECEYAEIDPQG